MRGGQTLPSGPTSTCCMSKDNGESERLGRQRDHRNRRLQCRAP
ncbi:hypothetical protein F442_00523 [Phytophthora nicotianae P10297]|uniref:Uncharacterized protein n=5 Tax=Phytophthora nicotianae TaxID=4792 RepID=W2RH43_PHYN3|nr:hypothetical protein PPTG_20738 [Phytophthora nicotianae INRA-310]ETI57125.1 hypothetical protein F443_00532 [Phytophthora nicotianae P1569]ETK96862.1 hypothetical protein L915_00506 [Phytophthora nicotianae]ETO85861.1 hypothetical protein F444_00529 [Phytophthora nicotianae P1976]ETP54857.1 hypothetical protein F442_00523 [Phytophthora nicotianae P10297]ETL50208.1 hypothetical protein L916_00511 [Phytophthora nicotianae]